MDYYDYHMRSDVLEKGKWKVKSTDLNIEQLALIESSHKSRIHASGCITFVLATLLDVSVVLMIDNFFPNVSIWKSSSWGGFLILASWFIWAYIIGLFLNENSTTQEMIDIAKLGKRKK